MRPSLIVMLTHHDQTVPHALEVFEACKAGPAEYWGLKDRGLSRDHMRRLVDTIKRAHKTICFEVVHYSEAECLKSAQLAVEMEIDYVLGTSYYDSVNSLLTGTSAKYVPFCGRVSGIPSVLEGSIPEIIEEAERTAQREVYGFDLLAYRYRGDPVQLAREFVRAIDLPVVIAGSIGSFNQLDVIKELGPWAFTIGSAFFEHKFGHAVIREQIEEVVAYLNHR
jgi:hypothetical protein